MSSVIHYTIKTSSTSAPQWSSIHFDGINLSCFELKQRIIYAEGMMRSERDAGTFDLLLSNSQNAEEYREENYSIHRNVSVIVKKIPATNPAAAKKLYIPPGSLGPDWNKNTSTWTPQHGHQDPNATPMGSRGGGGGGYDEDDLSSALQATSKFSAAPRTSRSGPFQQSAPRGQLTAQSKPPPGYICHRCKQSGHFIQFCPTNGDSAYDLARRSATTREDRDREREKEKERDSKYLNYTAAAPTGEKSVWLKPVEDPKALSEGGTEMQTLEQKRGPSKFVYQSGFFSSTTTGAGQVPFVATPTNAAQARPGQQPLAIPPLTYQFSDPSSVQLGAIPSSSTSFTPSALFPLTATLRRDLTCQICQDYLTAAQATGCCYTSYCDDCIRTHLRSSIPSACPLCSTEITQDDLQANPNLQKAVELFTKEHKEIERGAIRRANEAMKNGTQNGAATIQQPPQSQQVPYQPPPSASLPSTAASSSAASAYNNNSNPANSYPQLMNHSQPQQQSNGAAYPQRPPQQGMQPPQQQPYNLQSSYPMPQNYQPDSHKRSAAGSAPEDERDFKRQRNAPI